MKRIALNRANEQIWDVIVIGAGPAGSIAAREAARRGLRTLLVEREFFPRAKVCGCCLGGRALDALARLGLGDLPARLGARPLRALHLSAGGRVARLGLPGGAALSRARFDEALAEEAGAAGADFIDGVRAALGPAEAEARCVALETENVRIEARARLVLLATGLGGAAGAGADAPILRAEIAPGSRIGCGALLAGVGDGARYGMIADGAIRMACGRGGYVGLVRVEGNALAVAAALDPAWVRRRGGLAAAAAGVLAQNSVEIPEGWFAAAWRGTPALTRRAHRAAAARVLVLGDAEGYVEPFTGEGMTWAIESGAAAGALAADGAMDAAQIECEWRRRHERQRARQSACRAAAWALRQPRVTALAVAALACAPWLAGPLIRSVHQPRRASAPWDERPAAA